MAINDPYSIFDLNDAERDLYKLIIQYCKDSESSNKSEFEIIKVTDLIKITKYSKPKVYDIIKKLEQEKLIKIERFRPMFITPSDPEISFKGLLEKKNKQLEKLEMSKRSIEHFSDPKNREQTSLAKTGDTNIYHFIHKDGRVFVGTRFHFKEESGLSSVRVTELIRGWKEVKGKRSNVYQANGWRRRKEKEKCQKK